MPINRTYGRIKDKYNPSDQRMRVGAEAPVPLSMFVSLALELTSTADHNAYPKPGDHMPPVYDQGRASSCVGNGTSAVDDFTRHKQGLPFLSPSRLAIYYGAREIEGATAGDDGAEIRDGITTVATNGAGPETLWPYDITQITVKPSDAYYTEAKKHEAINYARVAQADYYIGHCLEILGLPIVFGTSLYQEFESDAVARTGMVPMPSADEVQNDESVGGHCMVIVARDARRDLYGVRNSWGIDWGLKGYCWMPRPYLLNSVLASDFWSIIKETL
jgi:C1A family cysteine protease